MQFNYRQPHPEDALSLPELELYHLIMEYRAQEGLDAIPLSLGLTTTAGRHAADTAYNFWAAGRDPRDTPGANSHSWSDLDYIVEGGQHLNPSIMWEAPQRIGTTYPSNGYEISVVGAASVIAALTAWQSSSGHDAVILNEGTWARLDWDAIGVGLVQDPSVGGPFGGNVFHVWFGTAEDPDGAPEIAGTAQGDQIAGTLFDDMILGRNGRDALVGDMGDDTMRGGQGGDAIRAGEGDDDVNGGNGRDFALLGSGDDLYRDTGQTGNPGKDTIGGGQGSDSIYGGGGQDVIGGGRGADLLVGGQGGDTLTGGAGPDTFLFGGNRFGRDVITDLEENDTIAIFGSIEAQTEAELDAALTDVEGGVLYDHNGDNFNTILILGTTKAELDLGQFDLG